MNPFQVPGCGPGVGEPLCPWRSPDHDGWYVDLDGTGAEFDNFLKLLRQPMRGARGRLIMVVGDTGTGKTSLIHRCAHEVDRSTNGGLEEYLPGQLIADLSDHPVANPTNTAERRREVAAEVLRQIQLTHRIPVDPEWERLLDRRDGYRTFFEKVSAKATELGVTQIVLLPNLSDWQEDVDEYHYLATRRCPSLVFFGESSESRVIDYLEARAGAIPVLRLGFLRPSDGLLLLKDRLGRRAPEQVARMDDEQVARLAEFLHKISDTVSARMILTVLFRGWDGRPPGTTVTAIDIVLRMSLQTNPGRPGGGSHD